MKKILLLLLSSILILSSGCIPTEKNISSNISQTEIETTKSSSSYIKNTKLTLTFSFGTRTGTYTGDINSQGTPNGTGTFVSKNDDGDSWTYTGDWVNGHWNGKGTTIWNGGQSYSGEYKDDNITGQGIYTLEDGRKYEGKFSCGVLHGEATLYYTDGSYFKGDFTTSTIAKGIFYDTDGYEYEAEIKNDELTIRNSLYDFFSDEERQNKYKELYTTYRYTELKDYIDEYIKEKSPSSMDSAYSILEMIEPLIKYENNWNLTHDDFDNTYTLKYKNVSEIDENNCVETSVCGTTKNITFGFTKNDWLFFDTIRISVDGKVVVDKYFKSYSIQRDTLGGSRIKESVKCDLYEDEVNSLINGEEVKIRFENEDKNQYYEKELSKDQIDAIYCTVYLSRNNRDLSNLLYRYNNRE